MGRIKTGESLYLGVFELPNESFPYRITGRLYAGYASFETDGPIAMVTHDVMDREKKKQRKKELKSPGRPENLFMWMKILREAAVWGGGL